MQMLLQHLLSDRHQMLLRQEPLCGHLMLRDHLMLLLEEMEHPVLWSSTHG